MPWLRGQFAPRFEPECYRFSVAVRPPRSVPVALNGLGLWLGLMIAPSVVNYGLPIARAIATSGMAVPAITEMRWKWPVTHCVLWIVAGTDGSC